MSIRGDKIVCRKTVAVLPIVLASALLAGCGGSSSSGGSNVVNIGAVSAESGLLAGIGTPVLRGSELAVDQINNQGGFKVGGKMYKLHLVERNNNSDPVTSVNIVRQFITQDHLKIIIGPTYAAAATPTFPLTQKAHVLQLTVATTAAPFLGKPGYSYLFRMIDPDAARSNTMPALVAAKTGIKSIAFVMPDQTLGHIKATEFGAGFQRAGVRVTQTIFYPTGTTDLSTVVSKVGAGKPDAVFVGYPDTAASQIIHDSLQDGITRTFIAETGTSMAAALPYKKQIKWFSLTAYTVDPSGSSAAAANYVALYRKQFGTAPPVSSYPGPEAYDTVQMLVAAMQRAGTTTDVTKIRNVMRGMSFHGLVDYKINDQGQLFSGYQVSALVNGHLTDFPISLGDLLKASGA